MEIPVAGAAVFKDRRGGLIAFGIIQILLGSVCALMVPFMTWGLSVSARLEGSDATAFTAKMMIPGVLCYGGLAVWFIWMGIGSIMARRWARALVLVTSWLWLAGGVLGFVCMIFMMPNMFAQMRQSGGLPGGMEIVMQTIMFGFMLVFYVVLPASFVLFYGSRHVKANCESLDARVRWTDRCPLPVLAVSLVSGMWAACLPFLGLYGWPIPFFGAVLNGPPAAVAVVGSAALLAYVAWGAYRQRIAAWWSAVALVLAWGVSSAATFSKVGLMEFYEKMGIPAESLEMMKTLPPQWDRWMLISTILWVGIILGYLAFTKKFFGPAGGPSVVPS